MRVTRRQLTQWAKSPYLLLGFSFLVWMLFFDAEDLITQYRLRKKFFNLKAEKVYYVEQIKKIQQARKGFENDEDLLEKFAREKYFMKQKKEDLYVVVK